MPGKNIQTIDRETINIRTQMCKLIESEGLSANQALTRLLPNDSNRARRLSLWIEKGLWPISNGSTTFSTTDITANNNSVKPELETFIEYDQRSTTCGTKSSTTKIAQIDYYPSPIKFIGPKITTSIKISSKIQEKALLKAKTTKDSIWSRGNLSGLVEFLLWKYLDNDPSMIEK
jgi:hypothetical protein